MNAFKSNIYKYLGGMCQYLIPLYQEFKSTITVGKVFKVIQAFVANDEQVADVAKRFDLDEGMVNLIKTYVK